LLIIFILASKVKNNWFLVLITNQYIFKTDIEMTDETMESSNGINHGGSDESDLDFCTGDDFLSISHSTALISPSEGEFDLIVKVM